MKRRAEGEDTNSNRGDSMMSRHKTREKLDNGIVCGKNACTWDYKRFGGQKQRPRGSL
jgi:hypothetical protein